MNVCSSKGGSQLDNGAVQMLALVQHQNLHIAAHALPFWTSLLHAAGSPKAGSPSPFSALPAEVPATLSGLAGMSSHQPACAGPVWLACVVWRMAAPVASPVHLLNFIMQECVQAMTCMTVCTVQCAALIKRSDTAMVMPHFRHEAL